MPNPWKQIMRMDFANPMRGAVHDPVTFATIGTAIKSASLAQVLAAGGATLSAVGSIQSGRAQNAAAQHQARQLEAQGKAELASSSIQAENEARQKRLVMSRARAVGAASGGGQDIGLLGDIEEEGTFRQLLAVQQGQESAIGRSAQASTSRFEGKAAKRAGLLRGAGTLMGGGVSFFERFGS